jgi:hypothetical protein
VAVRCRGARTKPTQNGNQYSQSFMNINVCAKEWVANFIDMWATRPGMVMSGDSYPLDRVQAFLAGLKWAHSFHEMKMDPFVSMLQTLERKLSREIDGSDSGVSWFDALLERSGGDQSLAFQEFIHLLRHIAEQEKLIEANTMSSWHQEPVDESGQAPDGS